MSLYKIIFFSFLFNVSLAEWVDPHSMDGGSSIKPKIKYRNRESQPAQIIEKNCAADIHLRRIVRLILSNAYLDEELGVHSGHINIQLTTRDHKLLKDFSEAIYSHSFTEISSIFETAFHKTNSEKYTEFLMSLEDRLYETMFNSKTLALSSVCVTLFLLYKLLKAQFSWRTILIYFLICAYMIDFAVISIEIIREEEIKNMVETKKLGGIPPECDPQKMSWWTYIKTELQASISEHPCKAYYEATYPKFTAVAPSKVLTRQFKNIIIQPISELGEAIGKFARGMFTSLPWGLNLVLFPIMLVVVLLMIFMGLLFFTQSHFKISIFHLFVIELGKQETIQFYGVQSNKKAIKDVKRERGDGDTHRPLIEELPSSASIEETPKKEKCRKRSQSVSTQSELDDSVFSS